MGYGVCRVLVTRKCYSVLRHWQAPSFLMQGESIGTILSRNVIITDASSAGCVYEGRIVKGAWCATLLCSHINFQELSAVFLSLKCFLPFLRGHHVLVKTYNTTTAAYINHQGGLCSCRLHNLARRLILWSCNRFLSLRAIYILASRNLGAEVHSRHADVW